MSDSLDVFIASEMFQSQRAVPARLQAAIALIERLRTHRSPQLADHLASGGSAGLKGHETFGKRAHERLDLEVVNRTHGRRSSQLAAWGQSLLDIASAVGIEGMSDELRDQLLSEWQSRLAAPLRALLEQAPLEVKRIRHRSIESTISDILRQADAKGKIGDVAQYLVAAKLELKFQISLPVHPANKADRRSRFVAGRMGDFEIENTVIEVALGAPDEKHLEQIGEILDGSDAEVWLITRAERVQFWQNEIRSSLDSAEKHNRVVVTSVEAFVGQNVTELGRFSTNLKADQFNELVGIYNSKWVAQVGTPSIRIEIRS